MSTRLWCGSQSNIPGSLPGLALTSFPEPPAGIRAYAGTLAALPLAALGAGQGGHGISLCQEPAGGSSPTRLLSWFFIWTVDNGQPELGSGIISQCPFSGSCAVWPGVQWWGVLPTHCQPCSWHSGLGSQNQATRLPWGALPRLPETRPGHLPCPDVQGPPGEAPSGPVLSASWGPAHLSPTLLECPGTGQATQYQCRPGNPAPSSRG